VRLAEPYTPFGVNGTDAIDTYPSILSTKYMQQKDTYPSLHTKLAQHHPAPIDLEFWGWGWHEAESKDMLDHDAAPAGWSRDQTTIKQQTTTRLTI
jgi:hypothetical protein